MKAKQSSAHTITLKDNLPPRGRQQNLYLKWLAYLLQIVLCLFYFGTAAGQQTVYLQASEFGRGILKSRQGECFVIAPLHVVEGAFGDIKITGERNVLSTGKLLRDFPADLAVIRIGEGGTQQCEDWKVKENYQETLDIAMNSFLEYRESDGSTKRMQVFIAGTDDQSITIEPERANQSFSKGMSGASLFTLVNSEKVYLGMLQQIDPESGQGFVIQADDMMNMMGGFFEGASESAADPNKDKKVRIQSSPLEEQKPQPKPSSLVFEDIGLTFELKDIKKTGSRVVCKFQVTSKERDADLRLAYNQIYIHDEKGLITQCSNVAVGNQNGSYVNYPLLHNVPVTMELTFENVASSAKGISFFSMSFNSAGRNGRLEFRNISYDGFGATFSLPQQKGVWSEEVLGFDFQLAEYKKVGGRVSVRFLVTNTEKDGFLKLGYNEIFMYDQNGLVTQSSNISLGNSNGSYVNYYLIKGVQTALEITFDNVASSATGISYFDLKFSDGQNKGFFLIRNLSFEGFEAPFRLPKEKGGWSDEILGVDIQFMEYKKIGGRVTCKFLVTKLEDDGFLKLAYNQNFMYDENGLVTESSNVLLGNNSGSYVNYYLIKGVQTPMEVTFDNVVTSAQGMSSLYIALSDEKNTKGEIWLRNLSFEGFDAELTLPRKTGIRSTRALGFDFQLMECKKTGTRVTCKFLVTNEERDGFLKLSYNQISLFDQNGGATNSSNLLIGSSTGSYLNYYLIQGVQTPMEVIFENVASSIISISALNLAFSNENSSDQWILKEVPLND